jgi:hypothetical protein
VRVRRRYHWRHHYHARSYRLVSNPIATWLLELTR